MSLIRVALRLPRGALRVLIVALAVMATLAGGAGVHAASPAGRLDAAEQRLKEVRERLDRLEDACDRNQSRVDDVNQRVEETLLAVSQAEAAVDGQRRVVDRARARLDEITATARVVERASRDRVVSLYKRGAADATLQTLLTSSSTEQALGRAQVLNAVKHGDREALEELLAAETAKDALRDLLVQQQDAYEQALGSSDACSTTSRTFAPPTSRRSHGAPMRSSSSSGRSGSRLAMSSSCRRHWQRRARSPCRGQRPPGGGRGQRVGR